MFHESAEESTKIGRAPREQTGEAVATKVNDGTSTSSPGPTPSSNRARWRAAVPLERATAWSTPLSSATSRSKASTSGPSGAIQLESIASRTMRRSSGPTSGGDR